MPPENFRDDEPSTAGHTGDYYINPSTTAARGEPVAISWNGRRMMARKGETLAAALLAHGERVIGRSFKFHRPRGVLTAGAEEPNALVTLGSGAATDPTARATLVRVSEGLKAQSQNCWPNVRFDIGRTVDFLAPLFPAGFYNKTFIRPSWRFYEGFVRRAAGLGAAPVEADPARYESCNESCDVLIIGGGPAGLMATHRASRNGLKVVMVEQDVELGGSLLWDRCEIGGLTGPAWAAKISQELALSPNVRVLAATTAFGLYGHGVAGLLERCEDLSPLNPTRQRYWRVRARAILLATGAIEQPWVFERNDLPGIMLAGAIRHYAARHAVTAGRRVVFVTNNDSAYLAALDLSRAGVDVPLLVDCRSEAPVTLAAGLKQCGVRVRANSVIHSARGGPAVQSVRIGSADQRDTEEIACDALGMSAGWSPTVHLFSHAGGRLEFDRSRQCFLPIADSAPVSIAGALCGTSSLNEALASAAQAVDTICLRHGKRPSSDPIVGAATEFEIRVDTARCWISPGGRENRKWVDFQYDVTESDVRLAIREGFDAIEHVKRYTTLGMAVDQGKTSNLNAVRLASHVTGRGAGSVGTTTYRPPFTPVTLGALAARQIGPRYSPRRHLPAHAVHASLGAHFEEAGGWMRPKCYPRAGESHADAIQREHFSVRSAVGLFDTSPLGKFEISGPDAARFLDKFYINNIASLEVARVRYGIMLNENGIIMDDGAIARLGEEHFLVTSTSAGAARVGAWFEEWRQCEWPNWEVLVAPVTSQWATYAIAGPKARDVLARLPTDLELGQASFPHLQARCGSVCGVRARVCRVSFSGELCFEISVPARYGAALWQELMSAGQAYAITPYGVEAALSLRLEKGYLHVGVDTDGTTTPADVGWGDVAMKKQADYIGKRSLSRSANVRDDRRTLIGLENPVGGELLAGASLRWPGTLEGSDGWITSAPKSTVLQRHVALALLRGGSRRIGEEVQVHEQGRASVARVCATSFYDPTNERLHD